MPKDDEKEKIVDGGKKGNELPTKTGDELLEEVTKKCNGIRYENRRTTAEANHPSPPKKTDL